MSRERRGALAALVLFGLLAVGAGTARAAKYAGAFMDDGGGARALALGGAFAALADDPSAAYWNPAGLSGQPGRQLLLMHAERFGDLVDRDYAAFTQPVDWALLGGTDGAFGVSLIRLGVDDIPFTDHLRDRLDTNGDGVVDDTELQGLFDLQDQIRFESDAEYALFVSYAERHGAWRVGGSVKFIRQSVGDYSSVGIGFDLGLLRRGLWRNLDFGVKFQDLTTTYLSWSTGENEVIAPVLVPGLAYRFDVPSWDAVVRVAGSLETHFDDRGAADQYDAGSLSFNAHTGLEVGFAERVFLRGGFDSGWDSDHLTAGAGFRLDPLTVDYAYGGDVLGIDEATHRVSVTARF